MSSLEDIELYEWQERCLDAWEAAGYRGIASVATGAGKTVLALAALCRLREVSPRISTQFLEVRIVVPRLFLAQQWKRSLVQHLGVNPTQVGLFCGTVHCDPKLPYVIYVLDSARYHIARHIVADVRAGLRVLLICDEIHHFGSRENAHVFDFISRVPAASWFALGLTATPDAEQLENVIIPALGPIIFTYDILEAAKAGVTAPWQEFNVAVPFVGDEGDNYDSLCEDIKCTISMLYKVSPGLARDHGSAFMIHLRSLASGDDKTAQLARKLSNQLLRRKAIVSLAKARIDCAVELARRLLPQSRAIFFTERIRQADALAVRLEALFPGQIGRYHSRLGIEVKQRALEAFRTGEFRAIVCCRALDEGLNIPQVDVGIIVSTGNNARQRIQRLGRLLRKNSDDTPKRIFYLYIPDTTEPDTLLIQSPVIQPEPTAGNTVTVDKLAHQTIKLTDKLSVAPNNLAFIEGNAGQDSLANPVYDHLANRVIQNLETKKASPAQIRAAKKHLANGLLTSDWLMGEQTCQALLAKADRAHKPYLQAMLLVIRQLKIHYQPAS